MKRIIAITIVFIITLLIVGLTASSLFAQTPNTQNTPQKGVFEGWSDYTPLAPLPGITDQPSGDVTTDLPLYLKNMIVFIISLATGLAVFYITIAGVQYMLSDSITKKEDAKSRIQTSLFGLLLAIVSYLILYTINPAILDITIFGTNI